jgi:hypothetical protein
MRIMNPPRDHHYIPVFYLKQWVSSTTGKLLEYSINRRKLIEKPVGPRGTGFERDLNSFPELPPDIAQHLETVVLQKADDKAALALRIHLGMAPPNWDADLVSAWSRFLIGLMVRHPDVMREIRAAAKFFWDQSGAKTQAEYDTFRGPGYPPTLAQFFDARDPTIGVKARLNAIIKLFDNQVIGQRLNDMNFAVVDLVASHKRLLSSDRPLIISPPLNQTNNSVYLPISPTKLFVAANERSAIEKLREKPALEIVAISNKLVVSRARRFVYARDPWEKEFIRRHMSTAMEPTPLFPRSAEPPPR